MRRRMCWSPPASTPLSWARDNLEFVEGDVYALDYADASFDVVYANQLLQHLADPVAALQEMRRVLRPGGLLGVRDADYATMHPAPKFAEYERWDALYHAVAYVNNAEPDAGRYLSGWVRAAGFRRGRAAAQRAVAGGR